MSSEEFRLAGEIVQLKAALAAMTARAEAAERDAARLRATISAKDETIKRLNGWLDNDRRALGEEPVSRG